MATQFPEWLTSLGRLRADLPHAVRGLAVSHSLTYPGNVTTATLEGSVKVSPDAPSELAAFTIGTPAFTDGVTKWDFSLTDTQTGALPVDGNADGVGYFFYDLLLTLSGGAPQRIAGGLFPISGFITEPA